MLITYIICAIIAGVFLYYSYETRKMYIAYRELNHSIKNDSPVQYMLDSKYADLANEYLGTIINIDNTEKSNIPASEIFNSQSVSQVYNINIKALDTASGTLVGIGLFGTFLGLAYGIGNLDTSSSDSIQTGINSLLGGMSTAFITSLVGMGASLFFTFLDKPFRNWYANALVKLTNKIDAQYYIDDVALLSLKNHQMFENFSSQLKESLRQETESINNKISYTNDEGHETSIGNAIREMLDENRKQTASLASFSTDLAIEMNNRFSETISDQLRSLMVPLMNKMITHIDQMAETVVKPSNDMMSTVAEELKESMIKVVEEFREKVADSATNQLNSLSQSLDSATMAMEALPVNVSKASSSLQDSLSHMQQSMVSVAEDIINKQTDLLALQEATTESTKSLLRTLDEGLNRLETTNKEYAGAIEKLQQSQSLIADSTEHLKDVSSDMKTVTETFKEGQKVFADHIEAFQEKNQTTVETVGDLVEQSGQMSGQYAAQFEIIKQGLADIFRQLQEGLQEYSKTVQETTNNYLEEYSKSHNSAIDSLTTYTEMLGEMVEELNDLMRKKKA